MSFLQIIILLFSWLLLLPLLCLRAGAKEIPMRDFFRNPEKAVFAISPDGAYVSFLAPYKDRLNIFVQKRGSAEAVRVSSETERPITGGYFWKGSGRLVYLKDFKGDENFHVVLAGLDGGAPRDLTPFPGVRAELVDRLPDNDREILVGLNKRRKDVFDVFRLDVVTGELRQAAENPGNITGWFTDHDGKLRAALAVDGSSTTLLYRDDEAAAFRPVLTTSFRESFKPALFTFDNKRLYGLSNIGRDKTAAVEFDPVLKRETALIYEHPEVDVAWLEFSRKGKKLLGARYATWKAFTEFLDPEYGRMVKELERRLPGYAVEVQDSDKAEEAYIVRVYSDRSLGAYYLYEAPAKKLTKLAEIYPWLDANELAEMKPVSYRSRDGLLIHGYLTVPKGAAGARLPLVVNPHGGPWVRDTWGFNPEAQFLASRGYAVLQVNYRGSTGYGRKFWEASFKQWGKKMQDDISDGVAYAVAQGTANPERVAIYGGSYGGYAALAGAAFTPDLYACAVDYVGVSNLLTFMNNVPPYWLPIMDQVREMIGNPETEKAALEAVSPALHAEKIKAPLLVAQGAMDPRVKKSESDQIVENLRRRGVAVEYLVKDNEGHGFRNVENRFEFYEAMEKFLAKHLKPSSK
ncbi:MAG TPA: S9 family peptidase [Elusimicrobia bacterium]|nr:MAG: peptidase [Elusimicrobia bacterium GWF2_62_30]HBA59222.1 S9 family peptidase [Elusimicrobiota bacterium]